MDVAKLTLTSGTSSSVMLTVVSSGAPRSTPGGLAPKESFTLSPSSSVVSCVAENEKVFSVSPLLNVTLVGTPE